MSKVQAIQNELRKLSTGEMCRVRDFLEDILGQQTPDAGSAGDLELSELRSKVAAGIKQARAGTVRPFDDAAIRSVRSRGRKLLAGKSSIP